MEKESGQILVIVTAALGIVLFTVLFVIAGAQIYFQNSSYAIQAEKASAVAEAGIDKALNSLNRPGSSYNGENDTPFGDGSYSVAITTKDASTKIIEATGYLPSKSNPKVKRTVKTEVSKGEGISFLYGMQIGEGGLEMGSGNTITGSVYSNGSVKVDGEGNTNTISGDLWVAAGTQPAPDQQTDCTGVNCTEFIFGKNVSGQDRFDVAQSFQPTKEAHLNKIQLKLKKYGNPPDVTVRILRDSGGKPDKNGVLATGTLYSSLVPQDPTGFGWIDITFNQSPELNANTTYWIVIDTSSNPPNYWAWQNDLGQSYSRGMPKWSPNWSAGNPVWNNITGGGDLSFKLLLGDLISTIDGNNRLVIGTDLKPAAVHANTILNTVIKGDAYYQTVQNVLVNNQNCTSNPSCHPASADPPPKTMPISDSNINQWEQDAFDLGGIISSSDITSCRDTLGPGKIEGSLNYSNVNNCTVIVKTPIWITGDFRLKNSNIFRLDSSYGANSGVIIVEGIIDMNNGNSFEGTKTDGVPTPGSYLMLLSTYDSVLHGGTKAIDVKNGGNTGVLYAGLGIVDISNGNSFKEVTAWKLELGDNTTITYETGLADTFFNSGPGGTYSIIKGTYQAK